MALVRWLGAALLPLLAGCIELDGQRITFFHDEKSDEIRILLHYDGVHASGEDEDPARSVRQIEEFAASGDFMILDWYLHVRRGAVAERLADPEAEVPPGERAFLEALLRSVATRPVGRYRDDRGRIGALRLVSIRGAKEFVARANGYLNESLLAKTPDGPVARTHAGLLAGAREGRGWIVVEGHSFGFAAPFHRGEWRKLRTDLLRDAGRAAESGRDGEAALARSVLRLGPWAIRESGDEVRVRLGDPARPTTHRFRIRDVEGDAAVDEAVAKAAPADLDGLVANALLGGPDASADPAIRDLIAWGPPEDRVRALLRRAEASPNGKEVAAALAKLAEFGEAWNRAGELPEAPARGEDDAAWRAAWWKWYAAVLVFPDPE